LFDGLLAAFQAVLNNMTCYKILYLSSSLIMAFPIPNSPDPGPPSPKQPAELPPPDTPTSTGTPPQPIDDPNQQAAGSNQANPDSMNGHDEIHYSISSSITRDQPPNITVWTNAINSRGEIGRLNTAAAKKGEDKGN
jgi:hypothetical protein